MTRGRNSLGMILGVVLGISQTASAAIPHLIRFQGQAVDQAGQPLEGTHTITFRLYDAETGGTTLWEETQPAVPITKGRFSVLLGVVTSLATVDFSAPRWVSLQLDTDTEMTPRQPLTSVPFAITAERLAGTITTVGANVGIGTSFPSDPLTVNGVVSSTAGGFKFPDGSVQIKATSSPLKPFVGVTTGSYDGAGVGGYAGGDQKCVAQYGAGARMCMAADFVYGVPLLATGAWYNTFLSHDYQITIGGVGTIHSTNDCAGWNSSASYYHAQTLWLWDGDSSMPATASCSALRPIACCK